MEFSYLRKGVLLLIILGLLSGCVRLNLVDDWWQGSSGFVRQFAKKDCQVYNSTSSQYDECMNQIDTFYKENY